MVALGFTQSTQSWMSLHLGCRYVFPKIEVPQNGWFIMENMENPIKTDDLGVSLFLETPIYKPPLEG